MILNPSWANIAWIALVGIGIGIQAILRDEALRDITAVIHTPMEFLPARVSKDDMLVVTHRARQRATVHLLIKFFGLGVGIWSLFVPPAPPSREIFTQIASLYLVLVMASLDVEGVRDLWIRRTLLSDGTFLTTLRRRFRR